MVVGVMVEEVTVVVVMVGAVVENIQVGEGKVAVVKEVGVGASKLVAEVVVVKAVVAVGEESKLEAVVGVNIPVVEEVARAEKAQQQVEEKALGLEEKAEEVQAMRAQKACT
ncbi:hypothetical protein RJ641_026923 [Dillenia turbinata]|uniref:Uncharacterized protein n=1 Tax=Dillenia turbinata TaxID=194707 RepID=A0AAN8W595_9MAGN